MTENPSKSGQLAYMSPAIPGAQDITDVEKYPRRSQRKAATRRRIIAAALRLAGEQGASNLTMAQVAEAADVHVTTLFTHFASKTELFSGISEPAIGKLKEKIEANKGVVPFFEFFREIQQDFVETSTSKGQKFVDDSVYLRTQVELLPAWIDYEKTQVELLTDYIQHDFGVSEIHARLFAGMLVSANIHSFDLWLGDPAGYDLKASTQQNVNEVERIFFSATKITKT